MVRPQARNTFNPAGNPSGCSERAQDTALHGVRMTLDTNAPLTWQLDHHEASAGRGRCSRMKMLTRRR
jgi:hypothetical protein